MSDLAILLSPGYAVVSTNRAQSVLNPPQILAVKHGQSGELKLGVKADPNTKSFVGRIKPNTAGGFVSTGRGACGGPLLIDYYLGIHIVAVTAHGEGS